jgi:hypothetical protein
MAASSKGSRGQRRRARFSAASAGKPRILLKSSEVAAAGMLAGFVLLLLGIALLSSGGTSSGSVVNPEGGPTTTNENETTSPDVATTSPGEETAIPDNATTNTVPPGMSDEEALQWLARRSIEVLPANQWPSLYGSFTSEFQQRCSLEEFEQAGKDAATQLGEEVQLLRFKRMENVTIKGSSAQAVIVGEIVGQGEYQTQAAFQKEDGAWKIAPVPNSEGCAAFNPISD